MSGFSNDKDAAPNDSVESGERLMERFTATLRSGLEQLLRAWVFARDLEGDVRNFCIDRGTLERLGITDIDLAWLIGKNYVMVAASQRPNETTRAHANRRPQSRSTTGYALTEEGALMSLHLCRIPVNVESMAGPYGTASDARIQRPTLRPHWNKQTRELTLGELIVKRYRVPAVNQTLILSAFQEEDWPPTILDPLPPSPGIEAKNRLHNTIRRLNDCQQRHVIIFFGNGEGNTVCWRLDAN
jgi:hypothetical protein